MHRRVSSLISGGLTGAAVLLGASGVLPAAVPSAAAQTGLVAVRTACSGCHREVAAGHFDRISEERKTPEGWAMTIFRMRQLHGVQLTTEQQAALIRYLSDAQGLAPSETSPGRFALERRPNVQDLSLPYNLPVMCGRCHSLARVALQRTSASEWLKLINFHVGQYPSLEYQGNSRNIRWWRIASTQLPAELAELFPLDSAAWQQWKLQSAADLAGEWIVHLKTPGRGEYCGTALISRTAWDGYRARYALHDEGGTALTGASDAIVYTGFEWRGTGVLGGQPVHEVYFVSADGSQISGRWFLADHAEIGGDWVASSAKGAPSVMAIIPSALQAGTTQRVVLVGRGLRGEVDLGPGTQPRILARRPYGLVLRVRVSADAAPGYRIVRVGTLKQAGLLAVYRRVDHLEVEPAFAVARLGGGTAAPVDAQFQAIGYADVVGAHGAVTEIRLGAVPSTWTLEPFSERAAQRDDARFAGKLNRYGLFLPAEAGPDPKRQRSAENTGNLYVVATRSEGRAAVVGKAHLIVTVQRWINPPIY